MLNGYNEVDAITAGVMEDLRHGDVTLGCYDNNTDHHHHHHHHHNGGARQRHVKVA